MRQDTFNEICRAAESGREQHVRNLDTLYMGKVIGCSRDSVIVDAFGHHFAWQAENCRPVERVVNPLGPPTNR